MSTTADAVGAARFDAASWQGLLRPRSIALVGASPNNAFHRRVIANAGYLGYTGRLYPVNPTRTEVFDLPCVPTVSALGEAVDMVAISVGVTYVEDVVADAIGAGARALVMYTAGLAEAGEAGVERQRRIVDRCTEAGVTLLGPNGLGLLNAHAGTPTFGADMSNLRPGGIALIVQSGSAGIAMLQSGRGLGFSVAASTGNEAVVTSEDLLEVLLEDDETEVVGLFLEGLRDGRRFRALMQRAHDVGKPVVALTVGSSAAGKRVVATHTGRLAGDARIVSSALRDLGVMVVTTFDDMVELLHLLTARRGARPPGPRLAIMALSGGELSMATDAAYRLGLQTPALGAEAASGVSTAMGSPAAERAGNPLDVAGTPGADAEGELERRYAAAATAIAADPGIDTLVVIQDGQHTLNPALIDWYLGAARGAVTAAATTAKPIVAISPVAADVSPALRACFEDGSVPVLRGLAASLRALAEAAGARAPAPPSIVSAERAGALADWAAALQSEGRRPDERDVKELLHRCGVSVVEDRLCRHADEAARAADALGYPVVMKVVSAAILHKSEIGGVRLGIGSADDARAAFAEIVEGAARAGHGDDVRGVLVAPQLSGGVELVVGGLVDDTFGPMIMVGVGGVLVEVLEDVAFALAPTTEASALAMLDRLRGGELLDGYRGAPPVDREAVARVVAQLSQVMAAGEHLIQSLEINPLIAGQHAAVAVDARVVLRPSPSMNLTSEES